jgi:two-component system sensor histidine kinase EvgS
VEVTVRDATVQVEVIDFGDGIDVDEIPQLFDEFNRLENEVARSIARSGLGLAISRKLARVLGGGIDFSSHKGEGSVFTLKLPLELPLSA